MLVVVVVVVGGVVVVRTRGASRREGGLLQGRGSRVGLEGRGKGLLGWVVLLGGEWGEDDGGAERNRMAGLTLSFWIWVRCWVCGVGFVRMRV